jgi:hypothetical protein
MTEPTFSKKIIPSDLNSDRLSESTATGIEAAVFRRLLAHLDANKEAQNIELMNLAGFCRNCLSKWYVSAAAEQGVDVEYENAREVVYGMPYDEWKEKYQLDATTTQQQKFDSRNT